MPITNREFAAAFNITPTRVAALIRAGMPTESMEEATAWREARKLRGRRGGVENVPDLEIDETQIRADRDFSETIQRHRELKEPERLRYIAARDSNHPSFAKIYKTYESIFNKLMEAEREEFARKIQSRDLIKYEIAYDKFAKIISEIRSDLLSLPNDAAPELNPDEPQIALKILSLRIFNLLDKWSIAADNAKREIAG